MNKPIIIIDAFLNTDARKNFFKNALTSVKKLNIPILLISNTPIPLYVQTEVNFCIFDQTNNLFTYEYDSYDTSYLFFENDQFKYENYSLCKQKHGLSVLCNLTKSTVFAKQLGFNKFIHIEWDLAINDNDLQKISKLIDAFIDKKAVFMYNFRDDRKLMEIPFHFWMCDLDFWLENYPLVYNEEDYLKFIVSKNNNKKFEIAERFLYLSFEEKMSHIHLIPEKTFLETFLPNSNANKIISHANFELPNTSGVFKGLSKVFYKGKLTGELVLFTWNSMNSDKDISQYEVEFADNHQSVTHETDHGCWNLSQVNNFNYSCFPITLKTNYGFSKIYNNEHEINSFFIKKNNP
jgi:hypothetical protein